MIVVCVLVKIFLDHSSTNPRDWRPFYHLSKNLSCLISVCPGFLFPDFFAISFSHRTSLSFGSVNFSPLNLSPPNSHKRQNIVLHNGLVLIQKAGGEVGGKSDPLPSDPKAVPKLPTPSQCFPSIPANGGVGITSGVKRVH